MRFVLPNRLPDRRLRQIHLSQSFLLLQRSHQPHREMCFQVQKMLVLDFQLAPHSLLNQRLQTDQILLGYLQGYLLLLALAQQV